MAVLKSLQNILCSNNLSSSLSTKFHILFSKNLLRKKILMLGHSIGIYNEISTTNEERDGSRNSAPKLTKSSATYLAFKLTYEERTTLIDSLKQFESDQLKREVASFTGHTKAGQPKQTPRIKNEHQPVSFCPTPEDWLLQKYASVFPKPTRSQLTIVAINNAIPFIVFGFMDNSIMIICGEYIELTLGTIMTLSTMAAAALGNIFSDVVSISCASYVEGLATKIGVKATPLHQIQLEMKSSRIYANIGRGIGVTIGCLLGMIPILFLTDLDETEKEKSKGNSDQ